MDTGRLEAVYDSLKGSKTYNPGIYAHSDGSPGDVLGHYVLAAPQREFRLRKRSAMPFGSRYTLVDARTALELGWWSAPVLQHFGLTEEQAYALFGLDACLRAPNSAEAQLYIRRFIASNGASAPSVSPRR